MTTWASPTREECEILELTLRKPGDVPPLKAQEVIQHIAGLAGLSHQRVHITFGRTYAYDKIEVFAPRREHEILRELLVGKKMPDNLHRIVAY